MCGGPSLVALPGCGEISAATIVGETVLVQRFSSEAAYARHIGVAPVSHSSGYKGIYFRSTRSGNRQLNKAIHRIAVTQLRLNGLGRAYYDKRVAENDSRAYALRCLKRRLSRVVFNRCDFSAVRREEPTKVGCATVGDGVPLELGWNALP